MRRLAAEAREMRNELSELSTVSPLSRGGGGGAESIRDIAVKQAELTKEAARRDEEMARMRAVLAEQAASLSKASGLAATAAPPKKAAAAAATAGLSGKTAFAPSEAK